jgi:hypothetical protein
MKRFLSLASLAAMAMLPLTESALAGNAEYDALVARHAQANGVPEALVHRVIVRESRYRPGLVGRGGTIGLMQIKLPTARSLGYSGTAEGLRDPDTNLTYAVKYLAGAYRAANGDHNRAVHYYASGYYYAAKQQRLERGPMKQIGPVLASTPPTEAVKPGEVATPAGSAPLEEFAATPTEQGKPRALRRKIANAKAQVPRPWMGIPIGANAAKPR